MPANAILISAPPPHGPHAEYCFCVVCKIERVSRILASRQVTLAMLHHVFFTELTETRERILDIKYSHTLEEIVVGYSYKRKCLDGTGYTNFGAWMHTRQEFAHLNAEDKLKICERITQVTSVYEQWEVIVENLTKPSMSVIEARSFSVYQFYRALNSNWCERTRDSLLRPRTMAIQNHEYDEHKFQALLALVNTSGLLGDVSHSREQARLIAKRFSAEILRMCDPH